jgi:hypothetical protein
MITIKISVAKFYISKYWSFMPQSIFSALETSFLENKKHAKVSLFLFLKMIFDFELNKFKKTSD